MELKKFKQFRTTSELIETTSSETKVEVKKTGDLFAVCINGLEVEYFKTKEAANEAAQDAVEAMESDEE
jgi:hypothetical protein